MIPPKIPPNDQLMWESDCEELSGGYSQEMM